MLYFAMAQLCYLVVGIAVLAIQDRRHLGIFKDDEGD
jgi:hypothetical protein